MEMEDIDSEKYKTVIKEMKDDTNRLDELILLKWPHYWRQRTDSKQSLSKQFQEHFFFSQNKNK